MANIMIKHENAAGFIRYPANEKKSLNFSTRKRELV
jgi:hypothetical protein